jgi:hypothetical protein
VSLATLMSLGLGAAFWLLSAFRPGWTRAARMRLAHWRFTIGTVVAGWAAMWLADPAAPLALRAAPSTVRDLLVGQGALLRLAVLLLVVTPLAADARGGLRRWVAAVARVLAPVVAGAAPAIVAGALAVRGAGDSAWVVLGDRLHPIMWSIGNLLLGPPPPQHGPTHVDPALVGVLYVTGAAALSTTLLPRRGWLLAVPAAVCGWAVLAFARPLAEPLGMAAWWLTLALSVALRVRRTRALGGHAALDTAAFTALLAGAVLVGFQWRWQHLVAWPEYSVPLSLDAQSYYDEALALGERMRTEGAGRLQLFFGGSTWFREPLYVFLLQAWLAVLGPGEIHAVFFSLAASLGWVIAAGVAAAALLGRATGAVTSYLLAADSIWIRNGVVGLREEVTGVFLAAAVALLWLPTSRRLRLWWLAPLCAAAAGLTRLDALPFAGFVLLWAAVAQRWNVARQAATAALLAVLLVPVFAGYVRTRGEAFPSSTVIATANWKEEFADRLGTPGFEEDRRVTAAEYLFTYHTPLQLAWYTTRGIVRIYAQEMFISPYYALAGASARFTGGLGAYLGLESPWLAPLVFLAGCIGLLARWRLWRTHWLPLALCLVGCLPPIGFIAGVPQSQLFQVRYAYMAAPFAAAILAWSLCRAATLGVLLLQPFGPARRTQVPS